MATLPLERTTVTDLTRLPAGPACVRQLADLGANVIQVTARPSEGLPAPGQANSLRPQRP